MTSSTEITDPVALERECVHKVYDAIAGEFSSTRHKAWPGVVQFLNDQSRDALGADVGCGNGKYLLAASVIAAAHHQPAETYPISVTSYDNVVQFSNQETPRRSDNSCVTPYQLVPLLLASDRSLKLARIVRKRGYDVTICDCLRLPYLSERLDYFICIAVIHHLSTRNRRLQAIGELSRLLKPGGRGLIQVWAKEQRDPSTSQPSMYLRERQPQSSPTMATVADNVSLQVHVPGREFPASDMLVPWRQKKKDTNKSTARDTEEATLIGRYYHLFVQGELESLMNEVPSLGVERSFYEQGNWAVIVVKNK